jgi:hypothetical protein
LPIDDERPASDSPQGNRPISGHHAPLDGFPARVIVCDVSGLPVTLDTIDALARLRLNARRRGCRLQLRNLDGALKAQMRSSAWGTPCRPASRPRTSKHGC